MTIIHRSPITENPLGSKSNSNFPAIEEFSVVSISLSCVHFIILTTVTAGAARDPAQRPTPEEELMVPPAAWVAPPLKITRTIPPPPAKNRPKTGQKQAKNRPKTGQKQAKNTSKDCFLVIPFEKSPTKKM